MQICNTMYHQLNKAVKDTNRENSNLKRAMTGTIRINIKLAKVSRDQKAEIQELNQKSDIIRFHELENTLEALMNGTDALLAKTATKDDFIQQLEAENNLLFQNNETLFGAISEQRMEIDQLKTENKQLVGTVSQQKMLIVELEQKGCVLKKELKQAKRGAKTAGVAVVTVENEQLFERNEELFTAVTNQEVMIFQAEQEKQKIWNQLQESKEDVEKLSMEVTEERTEVEALETQLVSELNFSIEQIGIANVLKERMASVEDEFSQAAITLLEKMHQEVAEHELEIDAWNREEERMLEQLEATNKRVITVCVLNEYCKISKWFTYF